jgi:hypothetical protein
MMIAGLLAGSAAAALTYAIDIAMRPTPAPIGYAFYLPQMFLQCLHYPLRSGDVFASWKIEQPLVLDGTIEPELHDVLVRDVSVLLMDSAFDCPFFKGPQEGIRL